MTSALLSLEWEFRMRLASISFTQLRETISPVGPNDDLLALVVSSSNASTPGISVWRTWNRCPVPTAPLTDK